MDQNTTETLEPTTDERRIENLPDLLTIDELAAYLQIPKGTLYHWRVDGHGPRAITMGKRIRYPRADVLNWISQQPIR